MFTPAECRDRAAECQQMAERAPNMRMQGILLDIARTWTRLAVEAEQWSQMNRPTSRLKKAFSKEVDHWLALCCAVAMTAVNPFQRASL
jgi:hypothetical protein